MKNLDPIRFDPHKCREELDDLGVHLGTNHDLNERKDVLSFFRNRRHLSVFIGSYFTYISDFNRIAYEYDVFGDFKADLVVGDASSGWYGFIEFENADASSIFTTKPGKATPEWSPRFEHGFSQLVDWFWKLSDMENTRDFANRFGDEYAGYEGLLIAGRVDELTRREKDRLRWRRDNILVNSKHIHCVTFDDLHAHLDARLRSYEAAYQAEQES
ncbi:MAG: DUF4263 domain-containing protein [Longimonas sp.]|uniref:Shedu immune nuclease family protein n=1 Tax=Longimonas sp. TaxID=2039626 RepID=UPI003353DFCA